MHPNPRIRGHIKRKRCFPLEYGKLEAGFISAVQEACNRVHLIYKREPSHVHLCREDLYDMTDQWKEDYSEGFEPTKVFGLPTYIADGDVSWVD